MEEPRSENEFPAPWPETGDAPRRPPWWSLVAILAVIVVILSIASPAFFAQGSPPSPAAACLSNVMQLGLGEIIYASDNDDRYSPHNWMDAIYPYTKNHKLESCPSVSKHDPKAFGYSMFKQAVGATVQSDAQSREPLIFDSVALGRNSVGNLTLVPNPGRHRGEDVIGYLDGHVKPQRVGAISEQ